MPGLVVGLLVALALLWLCPAALPGSGLLAVGFASPPSCLLSSSPGVFLPCWFARARVASLSSRPLVSGHGFLETLD